VTIKSSKVDDSYSDFAKIFLRKGRMVTMFVLDDCDSVFVSFIIYLKQQYTVFYFLCNFITAVCYLLNALQNWFMHNITRTAITVFYSIIS